MIKKTMTITSLAILVATISVATTMTMVQANVTGDEVDISVPTAIAGTLSDLEVVVDAEYSSTMPVVDAELTFADGTGSGAADGTIDDISELTITTAGIGIPTFTGTGTSATVDFVDANADESVQIGELTISNAGTAIVADATETLLASAHPITIDIDDGTVEIDLTAGSPDTNNIVVTIDDIDWFTGGPGAIGSFACSSSVGATSTPLFDENTLEVTISGVTVGTVIDVDCEFVGFHGDVEKALDAPCEVQIKDQNTASCSFTITYSGVPANVIDSVPAEWEVTNVSSNAVTDAVLTFADGTGSGAADGTIDDISELSINTAGVNVPDGTFTFTGTGTSATVTFTGTGTSATVDFVDANADESVQIGELTISNAGTAIVANGNTSITADAFDTCVEVPKGSSGKAATGIECNDATDVNTIVTVETRQSPGNGHKDANRQKTDVFKPTFCGDFPVNDGAQAILLDGPGGIPVLGTLDGELIVLDFTEELLASSVDTGSGLFNCDGELKE
jgi:hypothetical protein